MIEFLLDNRNGRVWELNEIIDGFSWSTTRVGSPASVEFSLAFSSIYQDPTFAINNGDVVRIRSDQHNIFYGFVFSLKQNDDSISVKCYDQVRYLLAKGTYKFVGKKTGEIIKEIADDFQLKTGYLADTGYKIPYMLEDAQTGVDVIEKSNTYTISNTKEIYHFYDDFGSLTYRNVKDISVPFYIGDSSLMTEFSFTRDIDSDTYNQIILYKDNKDTKKREVYVAKDSANIAKWGLLQYYEGVDENLNKAQIDQLLANLSVTKNKEQVTLSIDAIGDFRIRAGMYIDIFVEKLGLSKKMLIDSCKHNIDGEVHTMTLELKVI